MSTRKGKGGRLLSDQDKKFQQRVLGALTKLDSTHTGPLGLQELKNVISSMSDRQIPLFLTCVCKIVDSRALSTRKETASLFGFLGAMKGVSLAPYLDRVVKNLVARARDANPEVQDRLASSMGLLIEHVTIPAYEAFIDARRLRSQRTAQLRLLIPQSPGPQSPDSAAEKESDEKMLAALATPGPARAAAEAKLKGAVAGEAGIESKGDGAGAGESDDGPGGDDEESLLATRGEALLASPPAARGRPRERSAEGDEAPTATRDVTPVVESDNPPPNSPAGIDLYLDHLLPALGSGGPARQRGAAWCLSRVIHTCQKVPVLVTATMDRIYAGVYRYARSMALSKSATPNPYIMSALSNLMLLANHDFGPRMQQTIEILVQILPFKDWECAKAATETLYACAIVVAGGALTVSHETREGVLDGLNTDAKHHKMIQVRESAKGAISAWKGLNEMDTPPEPTEVVSFESYDFSAVTGARGSIVSTQFHNWASAILQKAHGGVLTVKNTGDLRRTRTMANTTMSNFNVQLEGKAATMTPAATFRDLGKSGNWDKTAGTLSELKTLGGTMRTAAGSGGDPIEKAIKRVTALVRKVANTQKAVLTKLEDLQAGCEGGFKALTQRLIAMERKVNTLHSRIESPKKESKARPAAQAAVAQAPALGGAQFAPLPTAAGARAQPPALRESLATNRGIWDEATYLLRIQNYDKAFQMILGSGDQLQLIRLLGRTQQTADVVLAKLHPQTAESLFRALSGLIRAKTFVRNTFSWLIAATRVRPPLPSSIDLVKAIAEGLREIAKQQSPLGQQAASVYTMFSQAHVNASRMVTQPHLVH